MKKSILQFSVIAAIAATMTLSTSCSSDDGPAAYVPEPLNFNVGVGGIKASTRTGSAAAANPWTTVDERFASGDVVAIYTTDADNKWYTKSYATSAASTADNAATALTMGTAAADNFYWAGTTDKKAFHAWSFGNNTAIANTSAGNGSSSDDLSFTKFTVTADQQAGSNTEFLYSFGYIPYSTAAKTIVLNHQLARIDLELVTAKQETELDVSKTVKIGEAAANKGVTIAGTFSKGNYSSLVTAGTEDLGNGHNGSWTLSTESEDIDKVITPRVTVVETSDGASPAKYTTKYSAVVLPQSFDGKSMFVITYDGATYIYTGVADDNIELGKKYTYKIEITASALNVNQVSIALWDATDRGSVTADLQ